MVSLQCLYCPLKKHCTSLFIPPLEVLSICIVVSLWLRSRPRPLVGVSKYMARRVASTRTLLAPHTCDCCFSVAGFFRDSPWLNVPKDRSGEILIEPLYPRGGLLGGTSKQDVAPKSKLAALAAARKKKENQKPNDGQITSSVALLDKLGGKPREQIPNLRKDSSSIASRVTTCGQAINVQSRKYPVRQPKDVAPPHAEQAPQVSLAAQDLLSEPEVKQAEPALVAAPSAFARAISGPFVELQEHAFTSLPHYNVRNTERHTEFDFAGPSPDDVVTKAQNSKGIAPKAAKHQAKNTSDDKSVNGVAQAVESVSIEDTKVRGKNLDVLAEFEKSNPKKAANFVVIGTE